MDFINNREFLNNLRKTFVNQQKSEGNASSDKLNKKIPELKVNTDKNTKEEKTNESLYGNAISFTNKKKNEEVKININDNANAALKSILNNVLNNIQKQQTLKTTASIKKVEITKNDDGIKNTQENISSFDVYSKTAETVKKSEEKSDAQQIIDVTLKPAQPTRQVQPISATKVPRPSTPTAPSVPTTPSTPTAPSVPIAPLPSISFPEIPEEKGSYENGTLVIFAEDTDEDGNIYKTWDYSYSSSSQQNDSNALVVGLYSSRKSSSSSNLSENYATRTITQKFDPYGVLQGTFVIDSKYDEDNFVTYSLMTEFDANKNYVSKDEYKVDFSENGYMKIITTHEPTAEGAQPTQEIEKIEMAKTVNVEEQAPLIEPERLNFLETLSNSGLLNLNPKYDLPNSSIFSLDILNNYYNDIFEESSSGLLGNAQDFALHDKSSLPTWNINKLEFDEDGKIVRFKDYNIFYDETGKICSLKNMYSDEEFDRSLNIERDENGNIKNIVYEYKEAGANKYGTLTEKCIFAIDENNQVIPKEYHSVNGENTKDIVYDENLNVQTYKIVSRGGIYDKYTTTIEYYPESKILEEKKIYDNGKFEENKYRTTGQAVSDKKELIYSHYNTGAYVGGAPEQWIYYYEDNPKYEEYTTEYRKQVFTYEDGRERLVEEIKYNNGKICEYEELSKSDENYARLRITSPNEEPVEYYYSPQRNRTQKYTFDKYGRIDTSSIVNETGNTVQWDSSYTTNNIMLKTTLPDDWYYDIKTETNENAELPEEFGKKVVTDMSRGEIETEIARLTKLMNKEEKEAPSMTDKQLQDELTILRQQYAVVDSADGISSDADGKIGTYVVEQNSNNSSYNNAEKAELMRKEILDFYTKSFGIDINKIDDENWKNFYEKYYSNEVSIHRAVKDSSAPYSQLLNIYNNMPVRDGKIGLTRQGMGDCWLLAAINTRMDSDVNDIIHDNGDNTYTINFKPCVIYEEGRNIEITGNENIPVSMLDIESGYYGNYYKTDNNGKQERLYQLSAGDTDTKIIEYAYLKMLKEMKEVNFDTFSEGNSAGAGIELLYGSDRVRCFINAFNKPYMPNVNYTLKYFSQTASDPEGLYIDTFADDVEIWGTGVGMDKIQNLLTEQFRKKGVINFATIEMDRNNFSLYLSKRETLLKKIYPDKENEIESAIEVCRTLYSGNGRDGEEIHVPTKNGGSAIICGHHVYTLLGCENGYIKLINPWNNQETVEISEIYALILTGVIYSIV